MSDKLPQRKVPHIPVEEWEKIILSSNGANKILNDPDFSFLLDYLKNARASAIELIATNSVKEVIETVTNKEGVSRSFKTSKEEQVNEIAGKIRFIDTFLSDLKRFSEEKTEYEKRSVTGEVIIDSTKEDAK